MKSPLAPFIIGIAALFIVLSCIFVPVDHEWYATSPYRTGTTLMYRFVGSDLTGGFYGANQTVRYKPVDGSVRLDLIAMQWALIVMLSGGALLLTRKG
jgi:hypothetical protein